MSKYSGVRLEVGEDQQVMMEVDYDKMNEFFTCALCKGYMRDTHTIAECVHSFCKSCIVLEIQSRKECPTCKNPTSANMIRPDHLMQALFAKLYPDVEKEDEEREKEWYKERNIPMPERQLPVYAGKKTAKPVPKRPRVAIEPNTHVASATSLSKSSMVRLEVRRDDPNEQIPKGFLQVPSSTSVETIKTNVALQLKVEADRIILTCKGKELPMTYTVEYIQKTIWNDSTIDMVWICRVK